MISGCLVSWASRRASAAAGIATPRSASCAALQACSASARASRPSRPWARRLAAESARNRAARSKAPTAIAALPASRVAPASDSISGPSSCRRPTTVAPRPVGVASARTTSSLGSSRATFSPSAVAATSSRVASPGSAHQHRRAAPYSSLSARSVSPSAPARSALTASERAFEVSPGMPSAKLSLIHDTRACSRGVRSCGPASASKSWTRSCRPNSNPSSAARSSRPARRRLSPSVAARRSADTATMDAPRRWVRSAVVSSSSATASSGPMIAAARCQRAAPAARPGPGQGGVRRLSPRHARPAGGWRYG